MRELLRRGGIQLGGHRDGGRCRAGRWPSGSSNGAPTTDLTSVDIRRFAPFNGNNRWLHDRVAEILGLHHEVPWPNREMTTRGRSAAHRCTTSGCRRTPTSAAGWAGSGPTSSPRPARSRRSTTPGASRTGCRGRRPSRLPPGPGSRCSTRRRSRSSSWSVPTRNRRCSGCARPTSAVEVGTTVYSGMLNERGTYESDVTVTAHRPRRVPDRQQRGHHRTRQGPHPQEPAPGTGAQLVDVTSSLRGVRRDGATVAGSAGRRCTAADLSDEAFPFGTQQANLAGLLDGSRDPHHLRGRAGLGALRPRRVRGRRLRGPDGRGRAVRRGAGRLLRDRVAAAGEGLPRPSAGN